MVNNFGQLMACTRWSDFALLLDAKHGNAKGVVSRDASLLVVGPVGRPKTLKIELNFPSTPMKVVQQIN
jgi:hypothetical protein